MGLDRMQKLRRGLFSSVTLLAFVVGINHCLLAAWATPASASGTHHGAHDCCHAPTQTPVHAPGKNAAPEPSSSMPCCIAATSAAAPQLAKPHATSFAPSLAVLAIATQLGVAPHERPAWTLPLRESTPGSLARGSHGCRAPPLA